MMHVALLHKTYCTFLDGDFLIFFACLPMLIKFGIEVVCLLYSVTVKRNYTLITFVNFIVLLCEN